MFTVLRRCLPILLALIVASTSWAAEGQAKKKLLYFTKSSGFIHDSAKRKDPNNSNELAWSEKLMQEWAPKHGYDIVISKDGTIFSDPAKFNEFDVFVFNTSGRLTDPPEANAKDPARLVENMFPAMTPEGKENLLKAVAAGKGFVAIHSANDTFHSKGPGGATQPIEERDPYLRMLGSEFIVHGAQQETGIKVTSPNFPGMEGIKDFRMMEEWYCNKNFAPDLHVIFLQETAGMQGPMYQRPAYPAVHVRMEGKGRSAYTSLGHREDVWTNPVYQQHLFALIDWAAGKTNFDPKPNLKEVAPGADELPTRNR